MKSAACELVKRSFTFPSLKELASRPTPCPAPPPRPYIPPPLRGTAHRPLAVEKGRTPSPMVPPSSPESPLSPRHFIAVFNSSQVAPSGTDGGARHARLEDAEAGAAGGREGPAGPGAGSGVQAAFDGAACAKPQLDSL